MSILIKYVVSFVVLFFATGCGSNQDGESQRASSDSRFVLASEPSDAKEVVAARKDAKDGDSLSVVGRVGGEVNPWVDGMAAFTIVDSSLQPCVDDCKTPWDYCCDTDTLPQSTATIKMVDGQGQVVKEDARQLLGIKELSTVVVKGKAQRDDAGNLTILAEGVFVKK